MSKDPNLDPLSPESLQRRGLDINTAGGLGMLPGGPKPSHLFDGVPTIQRASLESLGRSFRFPLRDVVKLYRHLGGKLDDTINIVTKAHSMPDVTIDALIKATTPDLTEQRVGQPLESEAISIDVKTAATGLVHVDMNRPIQFLVLTPEAAQGLAVGLLAAVVEIRDGETFLNIADVIADAIARPS